ncbi:MAG: hypothetical protein RL701_7687 [Pseudomonadota bacterium]
MSQAASDRTVARVVFVVSLLIAAAVYVRPELSPIAQPLQLLSTLAHEMGHGLAALAVGGEFRSFELFSDGSGLARTASPDTPVARALVAAGGLVGPALAAVVCFMTGKRPGAARVFMTVLAIAALLACFLVLRNTFGRLFVGGFAVLLAWIALQGGPRTVQTAVVFVGSQLALSVFSRSDYLFSEIARTSSGTMPSDVATMASALLLPYWLWGAVCGAFSIWALWVGVLELWR